MQNECSACRRKRRSRKYNEGERKFTWRGGGGGSSGAAAAGGGAVAELLEAEAGGSRTVAVVLLFPAAEREVLPPPLSSVSFPFRFLSFLLLLWFSFPLFSFLSVLSSAFFFFFFLFSPFSLFRVFLLLFPLPFAAVLGAIYRASECGFLLWRMGSKGCGGWSAIWVQLLRYGFPVFLVGARRVVGQRAWLARCGSFGFLARHAVKREAALLKKKN
jgi:hypothetical protein